MKRIISKVTVAAFILGILCAVLFAVCYIMTNGEYRVPKTVAEDSLLPSVTVNGRKFHAEAFGNPSDPAIIVVHGGPGWDYRGLLPLNKLLDQYYVAFYDQRGSGLSERVEQKELTLESSIEDLDAMVDLYGKGRKVNLIGHSWGAMLVSGYLGKHPDKVMRAILAEPAFLTTDLMNVSGVRSGPRWETAFMLRAAKAWFQSLHIKGPDKDAASDYFLGQVAPYANTEYFCGGIVPEAATIHWRSGAKTGPAIMRSVTDSKGDARIDLVSGLERIKSPVLFLMSECNTLIGLKHQKKQMTYFPNAKAEIIIGSGHSMFGEKPDESLRIIRRFLNED